MLRDSLSWGFDASNGGRHPYEVRWPSVVEAGLNGSVCVFAERLHGRTTVFDDNLVGADCNGARILPTLCSHARAARSGDHHARLQRHETLDPPQPQVASLGMPRFVGIVRDNEHLLARPGNSPCFSSRRRSSRISGKPDFEDRLRNADTASARLAGFYRAVAQEKQSGFFDASTAAEACSMDGVHMDVESTRALGLALVSVLKAMLEAGTGGLSG